jgi:hypothetical protein
MRHIMTKESELRLHWAELQELEQKVVELIATALKLAPGLERRDDLCMHLVTPAESSFRSQW